MIESTMAWILSGGPMALGVLIWGAVSALLLAEETKHRPARSPGLHFHILMVFVGLGLAGWLYGVGLTANAVHALGVTDAAEMAARGSAVSAIPGQLAMIWMVALGTWMAWNAKRSMPGDVRPARIMAWFRRTNWSLLAVALFFTVGPTLTSPLSDSFPVYQVFAAAFVALASVPFALVNIALARSAAHVQGELNQVSEPTSQGTTGEEMLRRYRAVHAREMR